MRQHREAMHGAEPRGRGRRLMRRTGLSTAVLGLLGIGAVQAPAASAAPVLESASPNKGCPGEAVVLTGKNFGSPGSGVAGFHGNALGSTPMQFNAKATITSSTSATTYVPILLVAVPGESAGTVYLENGLFKISNTISFSFNPLP